MKLIGVAKNTKDGIEARVHPMLIPSSHPLAAVNDSFNAIFVHADAAGEVMFYGRGAGELPDSQRGSRRYYRRDAQYRVQLAGADQLQLL